MARRLHPRSSPMENLRTIVRGIPWRLLLLVPVLILAAIPAFLYGARAGTGVFSNMSRFFSTLGDSPSPTPTPYPVFSSSLPQAGSILYMVKEGDSCDEILAVQMHMTDAGTIFSDANAKTVKALDASLGKNCHALQPGMPLTLSPQYPLIAFGGVVLKAVASTQQQQVLPTPLINVTPQQQVGVDCSSGCQLTVRLSPGVQVSLQVQTALPVQIGSWVWAQAMFPRKNIAGFDMYPYADSTASLNGASLRACDLQVDNTHDDNSLTCDQLTPNTIDDDGGAWLFGITGSGSLDHWGYHLPVPSGTHMLLWLTLNNKGNLVFHKGNPVYRYDENAHLYVRL